MPGLGSTIMISFVADSIMKPILNKVNARFKQKWMRVLAIIAIYLIVLNLVHHLIQTDMDQNIYHEFGISHYSSDVEIKSQYKRLSKTLHPDRNPKNMESFMKLGDLYDTLTDPQARFIYDKFGIISKQDLNSMLRGIFKGIVSTYSVLLDVCFAMFFSLIMGSKFIVSYIQLLAIFLVLTYLIFMKSNYGPFDILFPGLMTFEIIYMLTSNITYHVMFFSSVIGFYQKKRAARIQKKLLKMKEYCKKIADIEHETVE